MGNTYFPRRVISSSVSFKDVVQEFKELVESSNKWLVNVSEWRHELTPECDARKNYDLFLDKIREKVTSLSTFLNQIEKALYMQVYCGTVNFTGIEFPVLGPFKEQLDEFHRLAKDLECFDSPISPEELCGLLLKMKDLPPFEDKQSFLQAIKTLVNKTSFSKSWTNISYWTRGRISQLGHYIREYKDQANHYGYGDIENVCEYGFLYSIFAPWSDLAAALTEIVIKSELVYIQYFLTHSGIFQLLDKLIEVMEKFTSSVYGRMSEKLFRYPKE